VMFLLLCYQTTCARVRTYVSLLGTMLMGQDRYPHQLPWVLESA